MRREMQKWRNKDGSIKLLQIRTPAPYDKTLHEIVPYMEFLGIPRDKWRMATISGSHEGQVGLMFEYEGVHYLVTSDEQTTARKKPSMKDNARAILHIIQARVREMRKGVKTIETAFGGFVNWTTTPKLPSRMDMQLQERGIDLMLPAAKINHRKQLDEL